MPAESQKAVWAALMGNILVAASKFGAAAATGSPPMFSEGIHSLADTCNELLLLLGMKRSRKPPDEAHPLGHAHELYFWSFVVAVVIFGLGGGVTIYQGIARIFDPQPLEDPLWNYVVLALAAAFEGTSFLVGSRQFKRQTGQRPGLRAIRRSKDPTIFTVVLEDFAALAGLLIAFLGVYLGHQFRAPDFEAAASILIGVLLAGVALFLGYEVRGLLVGESAAPEMVKAIRAIAEGDPAVERANPPVTVYLGPRSVLVALELQFVPTSSSKEVTEAVDRIESAIRSAFPIAERIYVEAESIRTKQRE